MIVQLVWLAPVLPLTAAALIAIRIVTSRDQGDAAEGPTTWLSLAAAGGSLLLLLVLDVLAIRAGLPGTLQLGSWFGSGDVVIAFSFVLDTLALSMATGIALLSVLVLRFSAAYLHRETGFHRFFFAMNLFAAGMLLIAPLRHRRQ